MRLVLMVFLSWLPVSLIAQSPPKWPNQGLEIVQRYGGAARMVVSEEMVSKEPPPLLIADQEAFERFTALLPTTELSKTAVPGPNPDPLLKVPRFDWNRFMLLVVFDSQSLSFPPNVSLVEVRSGSLIALVEYPDTKNLIEAKPPEVGSYGAALVVRSDLPLTWNNPGHKAQESQRQSMMMFLPDNH